MMSVDKSLMVSLEEFGLSQYEARAYFAMISKGPISAAVLAHYADIPRTKVYSTLQKLQKKNLATMSDTKPLMCSAVAPEEAFDSTIQDQIERVNAMNSLISSLKVINDECRRGRGVEERRYQQLSVGNMISEMHKIIEGARSSIDMVVSQRSYVTESRKEVVAACRRGVKVRIILPPVEVNGEGVGILPGSAQIRTATHEYNYIISDGGNMLVLNQSGGGEVLAMADGIIHNLAALFKSLWDNSMQADALLDLSHAESRDAYIATVMLRESGLSASLQAAMSNRVPALADLLEDRGVMIYSRTLNDLVELASTTLKITSNGTARLDPNTGTISLESKDDNGHALCWALVLEAYLQRHGYGTRIIQHKESRNIRIHLEKTA
ncbi:MAG: hypothetical protein F4W68_03615 [Cenarchaeum sp. SB0661_bin_35]|nr:hypothetical protein [Cenarchaeum sp. SB0667_bin_13]MXZ93984.1 hypothetical protein [Cenarchaeum sp. SB0666_bin_15]MYC79573.1 hypothetical protein [Cenarchaeum sp. SB0661_bin_35]MYD58232.1 hypothetical protein [Cenarchaeum sp. SB0678_bin_8]MYI51703.1 hypothetical protein [Cenarchaeum sp. SB0673_bin_9]MYJ27165.1 hypothetical protein [Cenarchaeum sp. SB0672_bin_9]